MENKKMNWRDSLRASSSPDGFIVKGGAPYPLIPKNVYWHDNFMNNFTADGIKIANLPDGIEVVDTLPEVGDQSKLYRIKDSDEIYFYSTSGDWVSLGSGSQFKVLTDEEYMQLWGQTFSGIYTKITYYSKCVPTTFTNTPTGCTVFYHDDIIREFYANSGWYDTEVEMQYRTITAEEQVEWDIPFSVGWIAVWYNDWVGEEMITPIGHSDEAMALKGFEVTRTADTASFFYKYNYAVDTSSPVYEGFLRPGTLTRLAPATIDMLEFTDSAPDMPTGCPIPAIVGIEIGSAEIGTPDGFLQGFYGEHLSVMFSESALEYIGENFLKEAYKFDTPVFLPDSVTYIGAGFLEGCSLFSSDVMLPYYLRYLGDNFMRDCGAMTAHIFVRDIVPVGLGFTDQRTMMSVGWDNAPSYTHGISLVGNAAPAWMVQFPVLTGTDPGYYRGYYVGPDDNDDDDDDEGGQIA